MIQRPGSVTLSKLCFTCPKICKIAKMKFFLNFSLSVTQASDKMYNISDKHYIRVLSKLILNE